jgi:hypothetical protein
MDRQTLVDVFPLRILLKPLAQDALARLLISTQMPTTSYVLATTPDRDQYWGRVACTE